VEIAQLKMVRLIVETGSFYKTALRMNCAQSVVSRQLASLEYECGSRFFDRNARGVRLTHFGEQMLPHIDIILSAAAEMVGRVTTPEGVLIEEVKVALGPQIAPYVSGRLFKDLARTHPNIRLSIGEPLRDNIRSDLKGGRIEIAALMRTGRAISQDDRVICPVATCLVGLPDSVATANATIDFKDLAGLPLLLPAQPSEWRSALEAAAARKKITLSIAAEANASGTRAALVRAGVGYLIVPFLPGPPSAPLGWIASSVYAGRLRVSAIINHSLRTDLVVSVADGASASVEIVANAIESMLRKLAAASERPMA
jgi:LysR family transcriptional regulator, nitrogen assimilation regulatory protein